MIALAGVPILSKIYGSSTSLVCEGRSERDKRASFVKLFKQDYSSSYELTREQQDYETTRSLNLEGAVKAHSQQEHRRTLAIFLEDFGGGLIGHGIRQCLEAFCPMPLSPFLPLAINLRDRLGKIHAANIIHKDINSENIVQWRARLLAALGSNGQCIIDATPEIALIIGRHSAVADVVAITAQNRFNRVLKQFIRVFCSKEKPLCCFGKLCNGLI